MWMSDKFVLLDNVEFKKNNFQNRNRIRSKGPEEGLIWVTVPVLTTGRPHQNINEVEIDNKNPRWGKKCWKSIKTNYQKAEFYERYSNFFYETYVEKKWNYLVHLNIHIINFLKEELGIKTDFYIASNLDAEGKKSKLLLNICKELNAKTYISGITGKEYLDENIFKEEEIKVIYQDFNHPKYEQIYQPFIPKMSVIDLLFNHGDESLHIILSSN